MGIVIHKKVAEQTPCMCFKLGMSEEPEDLLCFSKGVIGALTDTQDIELCTRRDIREPTKGQKERLRRFKEAIAEAHRRYNEEGRLGIARWLQLVSEETRKRGIVLSRKEFEKEIDKLKELI